MKKLLLSLCMILSSLTLMADLTGYVFFIDPGHGGYTSDDRGMETIPYPMIAGTAGPDEEWGFWETNTNYWKAGELHNKLRERNATVYMSRWGNGYDPFYEIPALADNSHADFFISIHSNAGGSYETNYVLLEYRGYDGEPYYGDSYNMAATVWPYLWENMEADLDHYSYYSSTHYNIRGDYSFNGYGLQALSHTRPGFLAEGYFHTYQPARHRALNPDWCRQEGVRYFRGILDYYNQPAEPTGYIMGVVKDSENQMYNYEVIVTNHAQFRFSENSPHDRYVPCNGAVVTLYDYQKKKIKEYTVDNKWNGIFMFEGLYPGGYYLDVKYPGKASLTDEQRFVEVKANQTSYPILLLKSGTYKPFGEDTGSTDPGEEENPGGLAADATYGNVRFYYQGGQMAVPTSNQALWEEMGPYVNTHYPTAEAKYTDYSSISNVADFLKAIIDANLVADYSLWLGEDSEWKWLGDYMRATESGLPDLATAASYTGRTQWRFATAAFFNATTGSAYHTNPTYGIGDFTTAGQPASWQPSYIMAHQPTRSGSTFLGWFADAAGTKPLTTLPESGDVYACWKISGTVTTPTIVATPTSLTFTGEVGTEIAAKEIAVDAANLTDVPTVISVADKFVVTSSLTTEGGKITVAPKTDLTVGTHADTLRISANGVSEQVYLSANIVAAGSAVADATYGAVNFYYQGGTPATVPAEDNAALWTLFQADYNTYYSAERYEQEITQVAVFVDEFGVKDMLTNTSSSWKWLGDYMTALAADLATADETAWGYSLQAFFNARNTKASDSPYGERAYGFGDYSTAGTPNAWKAEYIFVHQPTKAGDEFLGWFANAAGTGTEYANVPTTGNVYACWKNGSSTNPNPNPTTPDATYGTVNFYLQGGAFETAIPADNEALWDIMGPQFDAYYPNAAVKHSDKPNVADIVSFLSTNSSSDSGDGNVIVNSDIWTAEEGAWKWLGDYMMAHESGLIESSGYTPVAHWRFSTAGFFNTVVASTLHSTGSFGLGDWTVAGQPASWQPAYAFAQTPVKTDDTFLGWFSDAEGTTAYTSVPESGNVYACWKNGSTPTDLENVEARITILPTFTGVAILFEGTQQIAIYNANGMLVAAAQATDFYGCDLQAGVYIIRVGDKTCKFVR